MTIPLSRAVLLWNPNGKARSDSYPLTSRHSDMAYTVGAVFAEYDSRPKKEQQITLLVEAIQAMTRDGVEPASMLAALKNIEGMAGLFADDC